jgi:hypothetical protein
LKRRLGVIFVCVSLATCAAVLGLWIRSAYAGDVVYVRTTWTEYCIRSDWGRVSLTATEAAYAEHSVKWERNSGGYHGAWPGPAKRQHDLGFVHARAGRKFPTTFGYWAVTTYHPIIAALLALPLLPWAVASLRRLDAAGRRRAGFCPRCGYDVRASAERCPECGEPIAAAPVPADSHVFTK